MQKTLDSFFQKSTFDLLEDSLEEETKLIEPTFTLGILGSSSAAFWTNETIVQKITEPFVSEQGKPNALFLSSQGDTSLLLEVWGKKQGILVSVFDVDFKTLGRRARALCDSRILKESTHLIFFLGGKSDYYEKMAIREMKKGKIVYCVDAKEKELVEWISE